MAACECTAVRGSAGSGSECAPMCGCTAGADDAYWSSWEYRLVNYTADPNLGGTYLATSAAVPYVSPIDTVGRTSPGGSTQQAV